MRRGNLDPQRRVSSFLHRTFLAVLLGVAGIGTAAAEPSMTLSPTYVGVGSGSPGSTFTTNVTVFIFGTGTVVTIAPRGAGPIMSVSPSSVFIAAGQAANIQVSGTFPAVAGPFMQYLDFTYSNSSGPVTQSAEIAGTTVIGGGPGQPSYAVGVIPAALGCPAGMPYITLYMDDEDHNNSNSRSGWIGSFLSTNNTTMRFCRVPDGRIFKPLSTTSIASNHYAVLQLGTNCPAGSVSVERGFDNENKNNQNWVTTSTGVATDFSPNSSDRGASMTYLKFCVFKSAGDIMTDFPNLGMQYGVFAAPGFSKTVTSGWIYTDDQDSVFLTPNNNRYLGDAAGRAIFSGGENTTVYIARVTRESRPVANCSVSPNYGSYAVQAVFNGTGSYAQPGRTLASYNWTFSDGSAPASGIGPHTRSFYNYSGSAPSLTFSGTLTVIDSAGESGSARCDVTVYYGS